jgi:molybdate transport system substrate-binding protein
MGVTLSGSCARRGSWARSSLIALLVLLGVALRAAAVGATELHVAVAANFTGPLATLAPLFESSSGEKLLVSSGSSGELYAQIRQGAPFDVFLSADTDKPQKLESEGLTVAGSRFIYAVGTLVLWSPKPGVVDGQGKVLQTHDYRFIGVANPQTAPYGTAAQQVLTKLGIWDRLNQEHRVVIGENITQTWQFAATGNAELAFVALSQVLQADGSISGSSWRVPQSMYDRIDQGAVVIAASPQKTAAQAFLTWLRTDPAAVAAIRAAGYRTAD